MKRALPRRTLRGFSLVELMVAMVIGLVGTVIIFQVFEVSEGIRRTTSAGGDAQQNGAIALYSMEADLRNAGMGFNDTSYAGCSIAGYDATRTGGNFPIAPATMLMVPVRITSGGSDTVADSFDVFYGSQNMVGNSTTLYANMGGATSDLTLVNTFGFRTGDIILLMQPGSASTCNLMEVTGLPGSNVVKHATGAYTLTWSSNTQVNARFNPSAGLGITYTGANTANATRVFNLGNLYPDVGSGASTVPVYNNYAISSNALTQTTQFMVDASTSAPKLNTVGDNIVHMRALYGLDDGVDNGTVTYNTTFLAGDGIVDRYVDGSTTPNWQRVIAVRVAVVARGALAEKPSSGTVCDTTTTAPTWSGSAWAVSPFNLMTKLDVSSDANWQCYRYKVFETTIPLRNWIWKSS